MMAAQPLSHDEQAAITEVMQMLETTPDCPVPAPTVLNNDISNQREQVFWYRQAN